MGSPLSSDVLSAPLALADCVRGRSAQRASAPAKQFLHRTSFARAPRRVRYRGARMRAQVSATAYRRAFMVNLPSHPGCAAQCAVFPVCGRSLGGEGGVAAKRLVGWRRAPWMCVARAGTQGPRGHSTRSLLTPRSRCGHRPPSPPRARVHSLGHPHPRPRGPGAPLRRHELRAPSKDRRPLRASLARLRRVTKRRRRAPPMPRPACSLEVTRNRPAPA